MNDIDKNPMHIDYNVPREIKKILELLDLSPRKQWGQNYLINEGARHKIVDLLDIEPHENIWEIGPGLGALTHILLEQDLDLTVFEIDPGYVKYLDKYLFGGDQFQQKARTKIIEGNALKLWPAEWEAKRPHRVVGNLPYNVASTFIASMIEAHCIPQKMVFTIQKELGLRLMASPSNKDYAALSIICQRFCKVEKGMSLRPGSFYPVPRVESLVIVLTPKDDIQIYPSDVLFKTTVKSLFHSRRKTIANNLTYLVRNIQQLAVENIAKPSTVVDFLQRVELTDDILKARAENLSVEDFQALNEDIYNKLLITN